VPCGKRVFESIGKEQKAHISVVQSSPPSYGLPSKSSIVPERPKLYAPKGEDEGKFVHNSSSHSTVLTILTIPETNRLIDLAWQAAMEAAECQSLLGVSIVYGKVLKWDIVLYGDAG
jgi:hypothetical protein